MIIQWLKRLFGKEDELPYEPKEMDLTITTVPYRNKIKIVKKYYDKKDK